MHLFRSVALADAIAQRMVTVATKRYIMGNYNARSSNALQAGTSEMVMSHRNPISYSLFLCCSIPEAKNISCFFIQRLNVWRY